MKDTTKVLLAMVAAAIAAWKLRKNKEQLKDLHDELLKAKDDAARVRADLSYRDKLDQPASFRRTNIIHKAAELAAKLEGAVE